VNPDVRWCCGLSQDAWEAGLLSCMCLDGTQCRQGSPDAPDATRCGAWVQDAQDAQDAESRIGESGRNTTVSDAGYLFADAGHPDLRAQFAYASHMHQTGCIFRSRMDIG